MTAPFVPELVAMRLVQKLLTDDADVVAAVGTVKDIYPNVLPSDERRRQLAHSFGGPAGQGITRPQRAPIAMVSLLWDITSWEPAVSQQPLDTLMAAVMGAMIGDDTRGVTGRFVDGARSWNYDVDWVDMVYVPLDLTQGGAWAPIRHRYRIALRPVD